MNNLDSIIIGGGLTGLLLARQLHHAGQSVMLLEARETLGGCYRRYSQAVPYASPSFDFFPATHEALDLIDWVRVMSPVPMQVKVQDHFPQVFDEGKWRPFAGFGETSFLSAGELSVFSHAHEVVIAPGLEQMVRGLVEQLPIVAHTLSEVTQFKVKGGMVEEVVVNGDKSYRASRFIFTPHPALINNLISGEELAGKHRTRLARMQSWTAVMLTLQHTSPLADDNAIRIFIHNVKEFEPVVGRIFHDWSKWITLVPSDREAEHEFVGQCIRHIKRQLKRAWPTILENQVEERIYVFANAVGQHSLKAKENHRFPEISNLYLANHTLASIGGSLGRLAVAKELGAELAPNAKELPQLGASC
jgi:phytoene dehydrogenase-like protein